MNRVSGFVESVISDDLFAQVGVNCNGLSLSACVLLSDNELPYCKKGAHVEIIFKEADTIISLDHVSAISCRNCFKTCITSIYTTNVMARVTADCNGLLLTSLITSVSLQTLNLHPGLSVWYFVKSTSCILTMKADHDH